MVRLWILFSTLLVASGWILSAFHALNRVGYCLAFALWAAALILWRQATGWRPKRTAAQVLRKFKRRFSRWAPALFLLLAAMSLVGGTLYVCTDLDANAYRTPRVLHWLGEQRWHWIHTADPRLNIAACAFEWISAPLILFSRADRWNFLINLFSYLLLPGLIFSVFTQLRVRARVAWWWMWLLSAGWCFVMQAGAMQNDSFATIYALASVDFALRARKSNNPGDLWLSVLAAGLLTGTKQTNIPLALLWLVAAWPSLRLLKRQPLASAGIAAVGLLISSVPSIVFNLRHVGTWTGLSTDPTSAFAQTELHNPVWGVIGNIFCLSAENLMPPYFPYAHAWDSLMLRFQQTSFGTHFRSFETFGYLNPGISEKNAGIGLGICVLVLISALAARRLKRRQGDAPTPDPVITLLKLLPFALLLLFMATVGTFQNARQLAPYYVFFFPLFLVQPGQPQLVRKRWWRCIACLTMLLSVLTLTLARSRPLFPVRTVLEPLRHRYPGSKFISQAWNSYSARFPLEDLRNCFRNSIPPNEHLIGYATTLGAVEPGLWFPFGRREVERVLPGDTSEQLRKEGIHYVVVESLALENTGETIEQWMARYHATLIDQLTFKYDAYSSSCPLYLVRLQ